MTKTFGETISHERSRSNRVCRAEPPRSSNHSSMAGLTFVCVLRFASLVVPVCCSQELGAVQSGRIARSAPEFAGARLDKLYRIRCPHPPALALPALVLAC